MCYVVALFGASLSFNVLWLLPVPLKMAFVFVIWLYSTVFGGFYHAKACLFVSFSTFPHFILDHIPQYSNSLSTVPYYGHIITYHIIPHTGMTCKSSNSHVVDKTNAVFATSYRHDIIMNIEQCLKQPNRDLVLFCFRYLSSKSIQMRVNQYLQTNCLKRLE